MRRQGACGRYQHGQWWTRPAVVPARRDRRGVAPSARSSRGRSAGARLSGPGRCPACPAGRWLDRWTDPALPVPVKRRPAGRFRLSGCNRAAATLRRCPHRPFDVAVFFSVVCILRKAGTCNFSLPPNCHLIQQWYSSFIVPLLLSRHQKYTPYGIACRYTGARPGPAISSYSTNRVNAQSVHHHRPPLYGARNKSTETDLVAGISALSRWFGCTCAL